MHSTQNINESLVNTLPKLESNVQLDNLPKHGYVDAAVQTESKSLWQNFKDWLRDVFSVNSSDVGTFGHDKVDNWRNNINSTQSVDIQDSESSLTNIKFGNTSDLQNLVDTNDSVSNISEVLSNNSVSESTRVYDITDPELLNLYMKDDTKEYQVIDNIHYVVSDNISLSIDPSIADLFI